VIPGATTTGYAIEVQSLPLFIMLKENPLMSCSCHSSNPAPLAKPAEKDYKN
jgi:hypothetical protein